MVVLSNRFPRSVSPPYTRITQTPNMSTLDFTARVIRRPSDFLPRPDALTQRFLALVSAHNVSAVTKFITENEKHLDLNGLNFQGHTALHLAVIGEDAPMVKLLLKQKPRVALGNVLLHAVQTGNIAILEMLLEHKRKAEQEAGEQKQIPDCPDFTADVTPLILAAQADNIDLVRLLIENGHTINRPVPADCQTPECRKDDQQPETLSRSIARINAYKAIASPAYICLTSIDPILEAFELNQELLAHAEREPEFKTDFEALAKQCAQLAVDLLDNCRTTDEVICLLNWRAKFETSRYKKRKFCRVTKAVDYDLKDFVTHPNCQEVLCAEWLQDSKAFRSVGFISTCLEIIYRMIMFPLMALFCWLCPWTKLAKSFQSPVNKYLSSAASYLVFLVLILVQSHYAAKQKVRGPPQTGLEYAIIVYVLAMWWKNLGYMLVYGLQKYLHLTWNIYECVMLIMFSATFVCWGLAAYQVATNVGSESWPRHIWSQWDPCLLGELFYGLSIIVAFFKLLFFFEFNYSIGMLQVSITRMIADTASFLAILMTIIISFSVGLSTIYSPYRGNVCRRNDEVVVQSDAFTTTLSATCNLYWGFFGYTPPEYAQVVLPEESVTLGNETFKVYNKHQVTETVGTVLLAVFYLLCVVALLNILVAMLTNSYTNVLQNADNEWKFNRAKIWLNFLVTDYSLPEPFNLLPNPARLYRLGVWVKTKATAGRGQNEGPDTPGSTTKAKKKVAKFSCIRCCYLDDQDEDDEKLEEAKYQTLLSKLIQRYFTSKKQPGDGQVQAMIGSLTTKVQKLTVEVRALRLSLLGKVDTK